jgi:hypothetical protein
MAALVEGLLGNNSLTRFTLARTRITDAGAYHLAQVGVRARAQLCIRVIQCVLSASRGSSHTDPQVVLLA